MVQRSEPKTAIAPVAEKQESQGKQDTTKTARPEEKLVDLGALATAGLPKDVTTEEIAALAAAAAHVKGRELGAEGEEKSSPEEKRIQEKPVASEPAQGAVAQATQEVPAVQTAPTQMTPQPGTPTQSTPTEDEVSAAIARLEHEEERAPEQLWNVNSGNGAEPSTKAGEDLPVTMAASASSQEVEGPRWTAVPVALDAQEGAISLEREMQSAFRAFTVAAAAQAGPATSAEEPAKTTISVAETEAVSEPVAAIDSAAVESTTVDSSTVTSAARSAVTTETELAANVSSDVSGEVQIPAEVPSSQASEFAVAASQESSDQTEQPDYSATVQTGAGNAVAEDVTPQAATPEVVTVSAEATDVQEKEIEEETKPMALGEKAADKAPEELSGSIVSTEMTPAEAVATEAPSSDLGPVEASAGEASSSEVTSSDLECTPAAEQQQTPLMAEAPISQPVGVPEEMQQEMQQEVHRDQQSGVSPVEVAAVGTTAIEAAPMEVATASPATSEVAEESVAQAEVPQEQAAHPEVAQQDITPKNVRQDESEIAETTAAAWASWRQIRDSIPSQKNQNTHESANSEPADNLEPAAAAMAVAAGAEANPSEAAASSAASSGLNSQTVASIVDNLLAELRPKIVEEISKKLAAEKK